MESVLSNDAIGTLEVPTVLQDAPERVGGLAKMLTMNMAMQMQQMAKMQAKQQRKERRHGDKELIQQVTMLVNVSVAKSVSTVERWLSEKMNAWQKEQLSAKDSLGTTVEMEVK